MLRLATRRLTLPAVASRVRPSPAVVVPARASVAPRSDTSPIVAVTLPLVYVNLPELTVGPATISYSSSDPESGGGIKLVSPVADTTIVVDDDGFILDYPGLAERI